MIIPKRIADKLNVKIEQVEAAIKLIDSGDTIPFIARYRKEVTGNLTDSELRDLDDSLIYLRNLDERIKTVLASIDDQGKLTPELKVAIENIGTLAELEDIYRPYKPKRKTRASIAKEKGLEPLAIYLKLGMKSRDHDSFLASFINAEKGVNNLEEAISGALDIIAEEISDEAKYRSYIKKYIFREGLITSKEIAKDEKDTYGKYANYQEKISRIPPHRLLAINRGESVKCLKVALEYDTEILKMRIADDYLKNNAFIKEMTFAIEDALKRLILPSVENEMRNDLFEKAEDASIIVFKKNLQALLLQPPLKNKRVLGFDPGFRTGCKYALVNEYGIPQEVGVVYLTAASESEVKRARQQITNILKNNRIDYIALGNGTASRESEAEISKIIKDNSFSTKLFIVNESGASVYSASKIGEEEFPDLTVEKRSAISLARRIQDPLSELVKIDPKAIGVGQYQHDMNQTKLSGALHGVVEDAVNTVGVNLNNCSISLLNYVAGVNKTVATNIYQYLKDNGPFQTRKELKKVPKLGDKAFEQCAGFLRILGGKEPLDQTSIHPESYEAAKFILSKAKIDLLNDTSEQKENALASLSKAEVLAKFAIGEATYRDIIEEIKRPGRDIRDEIEIVQLNQEVKDIKDLKEGMILQGTVRNIMDFGMFVDINVHQDGLVHISEIANKYVRDISSLYAVNDIVKVKVIALDVAKKRISLSIKQVTENQ
ncbi:MAG TPA: Tex family protein [Bacilli bacterium]|nr:Tex family protein [Bacilli bacterium]HPS19051.1 Tex family protein [Bacilli bacterium]